MKSAQGQDAVQALSHLLREEVTQASQNERGEAPRWQALGEQRLLHAYRMSISKEVEQQVVEHENGGRGFPSSFAPEKVGPERITPSHRILGRPAPDQAGFHQEDLHRTGHRRTDHHRTGHHQSRRNLNEWAGFSRAMPRGGRWVLGAAMAAGLGLATAFIMSDRASEPTPLTFMTEGEQARRGGRVTAPNHESENVAFSDGSQLTLKPGSSLRVRETDAHGAMVILEEGNLDSSVTHQQDSRWSIFAGPYEVRVVGTQFSTSWEPSTQSISVVLHQGTVQVLGKGIDELVELKPGQRFDATAGGSGWAVRANENQRSSDLTTADELPAADPADSPNASDAGAPDSSPQRPQLDRKTASAQPPAKPQPAHPKSWADWVAEGKFEQVLAKAKRRGIGSCLSSCSIGELRALADAARYSGHFKTAQAALKRIRSRSTSEAPRASYLLGSIQEAQGRSAGALEWYSKYLAEAPSGGFAAEARAGRMRALLSLGRTEAAKAAAREYLRAHPTGVGEKTARQILD